MTLQMRPTDGPMGAPMGVRYAPSRDIVYLYPNIVQTAERMLYSTREPFLTSLLQAYAITEEQLAEAVKRFCLSLNAAHKEPDKSLQDVLDEQRFYELHPLCRIALLYYVGTLCGGTFFQGIRDVVLLGDSTIPPVSRLLKTGEELDHYLTMGRVGRFFHRLKRRWFPRRLTFRVD